MFAPDYRQFTIQDLATNMLQNDVAYGDVVAAWRDYLRHHNHGRGVILVGHSQNSWTLRKLIAEEIDGNLAVRKRLVAAYLAGFSLQVPPGADVDGDFHNIPLCRTGNQIGCVIAWASYRSSSPPPANGLFGHDHPPTQAACINPAALKGGAADLLVELPSNCGAIITDSKGCSRRDGQWLDPAVGSVTTPFVVLLGLVLGECTHDNGFTWLKLTVHGSSGPRANNIPGDMAPEWGMHLVDMNVVMGNLQQLVVSQGAAWIASPPQQCDRSVNISRARLPLFVEGRNDEACLPSSSVIANDSAMTSLRRPSANQDTPADIHSSAPTGARPLSDSPIAIGTSSIFRCFWTSPRMVRRSSRAASIAALSIRR